MAALKPHSAVLFALAGTLVLAALTPASEARGPRPSEGAAPAAVTLGEVVADPHAWLGRPIRFVGQLHSLPPAWNPWLTRFGTESHVAVRLWGDDQWLWIADDFENPRATVFARRGTDAARLVAAAPRYARFELTGTVRQVFLDRPWIEVHAARPEPLQLGEGAVLHASRGMMLVENEHWALAADEFARARVGLVPPAAADELERLEGRCRDLAAGREPR